MISLSELRKEYSKETLEISSVGKDPIRQFERWFDEALRAEVLEPNAMTLSTVTESGRPSARIVLLKGIEHNKFQFYTNYQSDKGKELENNPACALTFFWPELERQVRIEGISNRVDEGTSRKYFQSRPRGSQIGAWASPQSQVIETRRILDENFSHYQRYFQEHEIKKPPHWGGYLICPEYFEFWQGRPNRLHDRLEYILDENEWIIHRLAP